MKKGGIRSSTCEILIVQDPQAQRLILNTEGCFLCLCFVRRGLFFHFSAFVTTQPHEFGAARDLLNLTVRCSKLQQ